MGNDAHLRLGSASYEVAKWSGAQRAPGPELRAAANSRVRLLRSQMSQQGRCLRDFPTETGRLPQIGVRPKVRPVRCSEPVGMIWYVRWRRGMDTWAGA